MKTKTISSTALLLLATFLLSVTSCKKDKNENPEGDTGKATAILKTDDDITINFSSVKDSSVAFLERIEDTERFNFRFVLKDDETDAIIEMMVAPVVDGPQTVAIADLLTDDGWSMTTVFLKGRNSSVEQTYGAAKFFRGDDVEKSEGSITITSLSQNNIRGTFNAILYRHHQDVSLSKKITITGGQFDMPLIRRDYEP